MLKKNGKKKYICLQLVVHGAWRSFGSAVIIDKERKRYWIGAITLSVT